MILYSFIRRLLKLPLKELFFSDASFRSQLKFITFNFFLCKSFIISYKILIITMISNETTNGLTIYTKLCQNVTKFFRQKLASLIQMQEKLRACRKSQ